jgi:sugar-specific transcriptional regulator TrmB
MAKGKPAEAPGPALPADASPAPASPVVLEQVRNTLEQLGLNGYQARVLLALMRLGSAGPAQLARVADIHRTSSYPVLQELRARGLVQQVPGQALWTTPGADEVLRRLLSDNEERMQRLTERVESTRSELAKLLPADPTMSGPYMQIVATAVHARELYDRLLDEAHTEFLVLNRPPYSAAVERTADDRAASEAGGRDEVNPAVLAALERGVEIRVLYEAAQWNEPSAESFRAAMAAYHAAGVQGRITGELPMKLVISDREAALFALADPVLREVGFPMNLLVEHAGYCEFQAEAFDHRWATATPVT